MENFEDREMPCADCGELFVFTAGEQQFFAEKGFREAPRRCKACRDMRRQKKLGRESAVASGDTRAPRPGMPSGRPQGGPADGEVRGRFDRGARGGGERGAPRGGGPGGDRGAPRAGGPGGDRGAPRAGGPGGDRGAPRAGGPGGDRGAPRAGGHGGERNGARGPRAGGPGGGRGERGARPARPAGTLHEATCSTCGNQTLVPFKPSPGRPVYCKDCFKPRAPR